MHTYIYICIYTCIFIYHDLFGLNLKTVSNCGTGRMVWPASLGLRPWSFVSSFLSLG